MVDDVAPFIDGFRRPCDHAETWAVTTDVLVGPCTQVHGQGFPPPSGRGRCGGDAGSLLPGVLPPN